MEPTLDTITLELVDDVLAELEELAPTLEELVERASAVLNVVTWDEATEGQPEACERLYGRLLGLQRALVAATGSTA